jgi:hypothetical protein
VYRERKDGPRLVRGRARGRSSWANERGGREATGVRLSDRSFADRALRHTRSSGFAPARACAGLPESELLFGLRTEPIQTKSTYLLRPAVDVTHQPRHNRCVAQTYSDQFINVRSGPPTRPLATGVIRYSQEQGHAYGRKDLFWTTGHWSKTTL